jgi:hypothetical protein
MDPTPTPYAADVYPHGHHAVGAPWCSSRKYRLEEMLGLIRLVFFSSAGSTEINAQINSLQEEHTVMLSAIRMLSLISDIYQIVNYLRA